MNDYVLPAGCVLILRTCNAGEFVNERIMSTETIDIGSLDPLDIGFDLRAAEMPVVVPPCERLRVRLPRSADHPQGEVVEGIQEDVIVAILAAGFAVAEE